MIADEETTLLIKRTFKASAEDVFDAWLTLERWQAWIGPEGMNWKVTLLEPRVGGRYRIDMRASRRIAHTGVGSVRSDRSAPRTQLHLGLGRRSDKAKPRHAPFHRSQRNDGVHVATGRAADCRKPAPARAWLEQRAGKIGTLLGEDTLT
jgi:Activator of Hsp90 ATPase homolog 1-like protein